MMKKIVFAFIFAFIFTFSPVIAIAASDISSMPIHEQIKIIGEHCYCGREFYAEDENGHAKYDCTKCGQNMYVCSCNCWCGAPTVIDTSGSFVSVNPPRICTDCKKPCILCDCRNDREAILLTEHQRRTGEISRLNILRPQNVIIPILAVIFAAAFIVLCVFADHYKFFERILENLPEKEDHDEEAEEINEQPAIVEPKEAIKKEEPIAEREPERVEEKIQVRIEENKSSGVFRLYKTLAMTDFERSPRKTSEPADSPDLVFTAEEISVLLTATKTLPNDLSPFKIKHTDTMGDTLSDLMIEGIVAKENDIFKMEENIGKYLSDIAKPERSFEFNTVFSGKYIFLTREGEWYSVNGKDEFEIRVFENSAALCAWIADIFTVGEDEKSIPAADISFEHNEFSLYCLIQLLGYKDPFERTDIIRPQVCKKIGESLYNGGFFKTAKTFSELRTEDGIDEICESMKKKGLLFESDGRLLCSRTVDAILGCEQLKDCVHLTKNGGADFEIMFAIRENGAAAIYDDGTNVRIVSAKNIPWKQYIK